MRWLKDKFFIGIQQWDSFWFKPVDTISLACFRFCFCSVLLVMYLIRFFDIRMFFYENGLLSSAGAKTIYKMYAKNSFSFIISSDALLYICYLSFIIALLLMALGVGGRLVALIAFVLHLVFLQRNPSIIFGADVIATFWLFYLVFAQSNKQVKWAHYFLHKRKGLISDRSEKGDWLNTMSLRFIQIQLCIIYMFSGLEKLKGSSWWEGTAIWEALSFYDFTLIDFSFLLSFPVLVGLIAVFTVLFEIYFPVLVWTKLRKTFLILGVFFHIGIAISLNIYFFAFIILSAYMAFIPPNALRAFFVRLKLAK